MEKQDIIKQGVALLEEGHQLFKTTNYEDAILVFSQAMETFLQKEQWERYMEAGLKKGSAYAELSLLEKADRQFTHLLSTTLERLGAEHFWTAKAYGLGGYVAQRNFDYSLAIAYYEQGLAIYQALGNCTLNEMELCHNMAVIYLYKGDYKNGITYAQKAQNLQITLFGETHSGITNSYVNFGFIYNVQGDTDKALYFFQKALNIRLNESQQVLPDIALCYLNIGEVYGEKKMLEKQLDFTQKALQLFKKSLGEKQEIVAECYQKLGNAYGKMGDFERSLRHFQQALDIRLTILKPNNVRVAKNYLAFSAAYGKQKQYDEQLKFALKAIAIYEQETNLYGSEIAIAYNHIGHYYFYTQNFVKALAYYQKALHYLNSDFTNEDVYANPRFFDKPEMLVEAFYGIYELLYTLNNKAKAFFCLYEQSQLLRDLTTAYQTYQTAAHLIDKQRYGYKATGSKLKLAQTATPIYEEVIRIASLLYNISGKESYLKNALDVVEKSKGMLLFSLLKETQAKTTANIPADLLEKEYETRIELTYLEREIQQEQAKGTQADTKIITDYQSQYFDYFQQYEQLLLQFETDYPEYYRLKYDIHTASISQVQAHLASDAILISYFVGQKELYIFEIQKNAYHIHQAEKPDDFDQLIADFNEAIEDLSRKAYIQMAYQLYQLLLAPMLDKPQTPIHQLIIIPHAQLHYLPFEALLTEKVNHKQAVYSELPYLIHDYAVSYHYSATLFCHTQPIKTTIDSPKASDSFIGFAPVYAYEDKPQHVAQNNMRFGEGKLKELFFSEQEVTQIKQLFENQKADAHTLTHEAATKENFQTLLKGHKYVHVAAHGLLNHQQPELSGIVFSPASKQDTIENQMLYINQAFHLDLDADLVVLSCCESGIGHLANGEGMMAMNRGLLYSGAKNIIYTLFKVYDRASAQLTLQFFKGVLEEGLSYSAALRQAKLTLLREEKLTPKSWAGFVLLGK